MSATLKKDALLSQFSVLAYKEKAFLSDPVNLPAGWVLQGESVQSPFAAFAFQNTATGEVVIAYRGSDGISDGKAGTAIFTGRWDAQFQQGIDFVKRLGGNKELFPQDFDRYRSGISVTGHSLGGTIAQIVAQAYGVSGSTIDPGAAARIVQTAEFRQAMLAAGLPEHGLGIPSTFTNHVVVGSMVSGGTGEHLGSVSYLPTLPLNSEQALKSLLVGLIHPIAGFIYSVGVDQLRNRHASTQASQALALLAGVDDGSARGAGTLHLTPRIIRIDRNTDTGADVPVYSQNEFEVRNSAGQLHSTMKFSGPMADRKLEIFDASGALQSTVSQSQGGTAVVVKPVHGQRVEITGEALPDGAGDKITTRNWLTDTVYQTDTYGTQSGCLLDSALNFGPVNYSLADFAQHTAAEYRLMQLHQSGGLLHNSWNSFTSRTSNWLLGGGEGLKPGGGEGLKPGGGYGLKLPSNWFYPIGAFYDSQSGVHDNAASIAHKTTRAMNAGGQALTAAQLALLDTNGDGQLSVPEAGSVRWWADMNENGRLDSGELLSVSGPINSADYGFYTQGNGQVISAEIAAAAALLTQAPDAPGYAAVPASHYQSLRRTQEFFPAYIGFFLWQPKQIMLTWNKNRYDNLIGTDGNDSFDVNYYASAPGYLRGFLGSIKNFMAGGGDDVMGGSNRSDNLWGGTGNDVLYGYAGDDKVYGEEGNDTLLGQDGNDWLDGGTGDDVLLGGNGDDVAWGGDGADELQGNDGNDKLLGQAGNDLIFGQLGNDSLWGGDGDDELHGNEGQDVLMGEAGNDRLFGQVGNDTLYGGDGNDVLVGFTASNEAKQTLNAGESDDDVLSGGAGNDNLFGGVGNDQLMGDAGDDLLLGEEGDDSLWGGEGQDELQGGAGNDKMYGGASDDRLFGQVGNDTIWGGEGNDLLMGFTGNNEVKQSLDVGESDDDVLYGGAGSDVLIGGLGNDQLYGGADRDELQGGQGNDILSGDAGNDNLFGQVGDDILYGGDGDDYLQGFTGSNEVKQSLLPGESDNDFLYGGAGNDILVGGVGNDYLDGGAGADEMIGGQGDDVYIVNSVHDVIYEKANEGYDTVITSSNYLLNAQIEELRLLEGFSIHGTGNALDNKIIGNSSSNILDGVTGADTMIGGAGDDTYYVDNAGDVVIELAGEGLDVVQSSISYTLGAHLENLVLLDFSKPEKGLVDGQAVLVYGYPKRNELDYMQGDAVENYAGTCALTSIANVLTQAGRPSNEGQVINLAIQNNWVVSNPDLPSYQLGGSNASDQRHILDSYDIRNDIVSGYNETGLANLVRSGRGVILAVNAGELWDESAYVGNGAVNHAVTLTGAVYDEASGMLTGFYLADSGRGKVSDMTRFVDIAAFRRMAAVSGAYAIYTIEPIKYWEENINGTGNDLANNIVGNRADNVLLGLAGDDVIVGDAGNDTLSGGAGHDTLDGGAGDDVYLFNRGDGADVINDSDGMDTLMLGAGISIADIRLTLADDRLRLDMGSDSVDLQAGAGKLLERVLFADGTVWHARSDGTGYNAPMTGDLSIHGQASLGQTLILSNTIQDPDGLGTFFYQWERSLNGVDWVRLDGATGASLTLGRDVVGQRVRAKVSFTDGFGNSEGLTSEATDAIANLNHPPTGGVMMSGMTTQGQTLTASHTLADADGMGAVSWQWLADGQALSGATDSTLVLTQAQVGKSISVQASYTDGQHTLETVVSSGTAAVTAQPGGPASLRPIQKIALADQTANEDSTWRHTLPDGLFVDPEGDALTYSGGSGFEHVQFSDGTQRGVTELLTQLAEPSHASITAIEFIELGYPSVSEDTVWNFRPHAFTGADALDGLALQAAQADGSPLPHWLSFDANTNAFGGIPSHGDVGSIAIKVTAANISGASASSVGLLPVY